MDTEEAEYAWLPIYCLKPFEKGDAAKHAGREGQTGEDANLSACVAAAERALTSILELQDKRAEAAADEDEADSAAESDSDGGAPITSTLYIALIAACMQGRMSRLKSASAGMYSFPMQCSRSIVCGSQRDCVVAGWGGPPRQVETAATRSRGRGGRGRRGRGRGTPLLHCKVSITAVCCLRSSLNRLMHPVYSLFSML